MKIRKLLEGSSAFIGEIAFLLPFCHSVILPYSGSGAVNFQFVKEIVYQGNTNGAEMIGCDIARRKHSHKKLLKLV